MNTLFDEEIRGHHAMRDLALSVVTDDDLTVPMPGDNPTLGELLLELGDLQGVYTNSFVTFGLDWAHRRIPPPSPLTVAALELWFAEHDAAMKEALDRFDETELRAPRIDRGGGFIASPFVQHEIYREAVYIFYGRIHVHLRMLGRDAGPQWAAWIG